MTLYQRPTDEECFDFHRDYVAKVPDGNIIDTLQEQMKGMAQFVLEIPADQLDVIHAPYGWTIRTVIAHCCDAERVFGYRILRFATGDTTVLPGWDENHYAASDFSDLGEIQNVCAEFSMQRMSNLQLLKRLRPETFSRIGSADGRKMSVRTIAWLMAGHWMHHEAIIKKRLGKA